MIDSYPFEPVDLANVTAESVAPISLFNNSMRKAWSAGLAGAMRGLAGAKRCRLGRCDKSPGGQPQPGQDREEGEESLGGLELTFTDHCRLRRRWFHNDIIEIYGWVGARVSGPGCAT